MGAKNHGVIMSDANKEYTINQLVGAAFGAAGQRCMALTTAVMVGEAQNWLPEVANRASKLKVCVLFKRLFKIWLCGLSLEYSPVSTLSQKY